MAFCVPLANDTPAHTQTDKKSLGAKAMLTEMRELVDKRKAQEASGADLSSQGPPELVYAYSDRCACGWRAPGCCGCARRTRLGCWAQARAPPALGAVCIRCMSAWCAVLLHAGPATPGLRGVLPCRAVHEDVFRVIKYSFDETLSPETAARCTQLWVTFLEPFFGLPPRSAATLKVGCAG